MVWWFQPYTFSPFASQEMLQDMFRNFFFSGIRPEHAAWGFSRVPEIAAFWGNPLVMSK
jgi:hypothetical protein